MLAAMDHFIPNKKIFLTALALGLLWMSPAVQAYDDAGQQGNEKELFLIAQKAFDDGFYDVAIRYINQLLEQFPQTEKRLAARLLLGQCLFFKTQYIQAYEIFNDLLQYAEFKDATLFWLGETYLKGSNYDEAEKQYKRLIELYPKSVYTPQAIYSLGWIHFDRALYEKALETFQKLIQDYPEHSFYEDALFKIGETLYNLHQYEEAIDQFKKFIVTFSDSNRHAECYFYIAESYYYLGNSLTAVTYYAKTAEIAYDNKLALMAKVSMGWAYLKLEKYKLAQEHFDSALAFSQAKGILSDDVYLGQASLYSEMKEYEKAVTAYTNLIQTFPLSQRLAEAYLGKANVHYILEQYAQAILDYTAIIDQYTSDPQRQDLVEKAYFGLAWSYLKDGDIDAAIKKFETIKEKTENKTIKISALTQIGDAYQDVGEYQKAIDIYDQILKNYSDSLYTDYVQYRQGIALLKMNNIHAATLSFQSLQANFPDSKYIIDSKYYLAVAHFKKEDWTAAKTFILEYIDNQPESNEFLAEALHILALSDFNLKNYQDSMKTSQRILKNYPTQSAIVKNAELNIAKCIYKTDNVNEGLKRFNLLINKYPQSDVAQQSLLWIGDHYLELSEFDQAIKYYQHFIEDFPGSDKLNIVYFELGQSYAAKEEFDNAIAFYKKITNTDNKLYAKAKLAIADIFSRKIDPENALQTYENIIEQSPEYKRDAFIRIADIKKNKNDLEAAVLSYQNALKTKNSTSEYIDAQIQFLIGDTYETMHLADKAVEEYLKVTYLYPKDTPWVIKAYLRIARIFEELEQWEQATITYNKILTFNSDEVKFAQERLDWIANNIRRDHNE